LSIGRSSTELRSGSSSPKPCPRSKSRCSVCSREFAQASSPPRTRRLWVKFPWLCDASSAPLRAVKSSWLESRKVTTIHTLNPLQDSRWPEFLQSHPAASVFHTPSWLEALRRTYGYEPTVFTTSAPGEELQNGIVFCRVNDWLRGCRMVSVPFSDHCQPLVDSEENLKLLLGALRQNREREKW